MMRTDSAKQDLLKEINRLSREIVQCQNSMECGRPYHGTPAEQMSWLGKLQTELAEAEARLSQLKD
jgi:hypothetical protein